MSKIQSILYEDATQNVLETSDSLSAHPGGDPDAVEALREARALFADLAESANKPRVSGSSSETFPDDRSVNCQRAYVRVSASHR